MQDLATVYERAERMSERVDRSQFELDALIDRLDYDADSAIRFVTEEIRFEPYAGSLRGARGTLVSAAGNALDQAILLARLLKDSGYEARIQRGSLPAETAAMLVQGPLKPRRHRSPLDGADLENTLREILGPEVTENDGFALIVQSLEQGVPVTVTEQYDRAQRHREFLQRSLREAGISMRREAFTAQLAKASEDYFWVTWRDGPGSAWRDVHPAFGNEAVAGRTPKVAETFAETIPDALLHRVRFALVIEQKQGADLVEHTLFAWERPAANLLGRELTFTNIPNGFVGREDLAKPREIASNTTLFTPVLSIDGDPIAPASLFDRNGRPLPLDAGSAAGGLFQTLSEKMEAALAVGATDEGGAADDTLALTAQKLVVTLIAPGGAETVRERYLLDRIGEGMRRSGSVRLARDQDFAEAVWQLSRQHNVMVTTGSYAPAYLLDRYLSSVLTTRPMMEAALREEFMPDQADDDLAKSLGEIDNPESLYQAAMFSLVDGTDPGASLFLQAPAVTVLSRGAELTPDGLASFQAVDVLSHPTLGVRERGNSSSEALDLNMLSGAWVTEIENSAIESHRARWNTGAAFELAASRDIPIKVLRPEAQDDLSLPGYSADVLEALRSDLERGYHVIVPGRGFSDREAAGWWRVDTATGETLGMINEGLGGAVTLDYQTVLTFVSLKVAVLLAIPDLMDCQNKPQANGRQCSNAGCLKAAGVNVFTNFAFGYAVGLIAGALTAGVSVKIAGTALQNLDDAARMGVEVGTARGMDIANAFDALPKLPNCLD